MTEDFRQHDYEVLDFHGELVEIDRLGVWGPPEVERSWHRHMPQTGVGLTSRSLDYSLGSILRLSLWGSASWFASFVVGARRGLQANESASWGAAVQS